MLFILLDVAGIFLCEEEDRLRARPHSSFIPKQALPEIPPFCTYGRNCKLYRSEKVTMQTVIDSFKKNVTTTSDVKNTPPVTPLVGCRKEHHLMNCSRCDLIIVSHLVIDLPALAGQARFFSASLILTCEEN